MYISCKKFVYLYKVYLPAYPPVLTGEMRDVTTNQRPVLGCKFCNVEGWDGTHRCQNSLSCGINIIPVLIVPVLHQIRIG